MSAIAERAHSCIGSLYQFFPNKRSLAEALRARYVKDIEQSWTALRRDAPALSAERLACRLVTLQIENAKSHPAFLSLLDVPPTSHAPMRSELIRTWIFAVLVAHKPLMPRAMALRIASVVQQVSTGLLRLYAMVDAQEKPAVIEEFKSVLTGYLTPKLRQRSMADGKRSKASLRSAESGRKG